MNHLLNDRDGSTPIDPEQLEGLKFSHVTTMGELDELEDVNIQDGLDWLSRQKDKNCLNNEFLCKLHVKLFGNVWKWVGKFRKLDVNISKTRSYDVAPQLKNLFEDAKLWVQSEKMDWNEIMAELHHRLVQIHPFPNGNGRTSRIFIEYFERIHDRPVTSWMISLKDFPQKRRDLYIKALRKADAGDYGELIEFMKEKKNQNP